MPDRSAPVPKDPVGQSDWNWSALRGKVTVAPREVGKRHYLMGMRFPTSSTRDNDVTLVKDDYACPLIAGSCLTMPFHGDRAAGFDRCRQTRHHEQAALGMATI